jgi:uncharacterized protein
VSGIGDDQADRPPLPFAGEPLANEPSPAEPGPAEIVAPALPQPPARVLPENPPWSLWDVLAIALVTFGSITIIGFIGLMAASRHYHLAITDLAHNPKLLIPVECLAYVVTLVFMGMVIRSRQLPFWKTVGWKRVAGLPMYPILGILLAFAIGLATALLPIPKELPIEKYFADTVGTWMLAIFGVTIAPLMEELFFRGFLYPALARPLGIRWSVAITSLLFALIHASQLADAWAPLLLLFLVGLVLTTARVRTGSIVPGLLIHSAYNLTLFVELYFQTEHFHNFDKI